MRRGFHARDRRLGGKVSHRKMGCRGPGWLVWTLRALRLGKAGRGRVGVCCRSRPQRSRSPPGGDRGLGSKGCRVVGLKGGAKAVWNSMRCGIHACVQAGAVQAGCGARGGERAGGHRGRRARPEPVLVRVPRFQRGLGSRTKREARPQQALLHARDHRLGGIGVKGCRVFRVLRVLGLKGEAKAVWNPMRAVWIPCARSPPAGEGGARPGGCVWASRWGSVSGQAASLNSRPRTSSILLYSILLYSIILYSILGLEGSPSS
jgi:hypothetical protein